MGVQREQLFVSIQDMTTNVLKISNDFYDTPVINNGD